MQDSPLRKNINRWGELIHKLEDGLLCLLLGTMILLATLQIVLRNSFDTGLVWGDPLLRIMVLWLGLLGALAATRENKHIAIDVLSNFVAERVMKYIQIIVYLVSLSVCAIIAWVACEMVIVDYQEQVQAFAELPAWYFELIIPLGFGLMAVRFLIHAFNQITKIYSDLRAPQ